MFDLVIKKFDIEPHVDFIRGICDEYEEKRNIIRNISSVLDSDTFKENLTYFIKNSLHPAHQSNIEFNDMNAAVSILNSQFWSRCMSTVDILEILPMERKQAWNKMILEGTAPTFDYETVINTIQSLTALEDRFYAERVDGVFKRLSKSHMTNKPMGFGQRMIFNNFCENFNYKWFSSSGVDTLIDLRMIILSMFEESPSHSIVRETTRGILCSAVENYGDWTFIDGGSMRIKIFKVGTAHIEVHPDIAYRLNRSLASLHPNLIPSEFREAPKKKHKEFTYLHKPLLCDTISFLNNLLTMKPKVVDGVHEYFFPWIDFKKKSKVVSEEINSVIESISGVMNPGEPRIWFDFDPKSILKTIVQSGVIPEDKSHQFYPTPDNIAEYAISMLRLRDGMSLLEPSAGNGQLVKAAFKNNKVHLTAIELSNLRANLLRNRFNDIQVHNMDFMKYECESGYDRILMNPPFADKRYASHVEHALSMLKDDGILVAVVPTSYKPEISGYGVEYLNTFDNQFDNTGISVRVIRMERSKF